MNIQVKCNKRHSQSSNIFQNDFGMLTLQNNEVWDFFLYIYIEVWNPN